MKVNMDLQQVDQLQWQYLIGLSILQMSWFIDTVCLFHVLICIMHSAFNLLVYPNSMFTPFLFFHSEWAMRSPEK